MCVWHERKKANEEVIEGRGPCSDLHLHVSRNLVTTCIMSVTVGFTTHTLFAPARLQDPRRGKSSEERGNCASTLSAKVQADRSKYVLGWHLAASKVSKNRLSGLGVCGLIWRKKTLPELGVLHSKYFLPKRKGPS